jgi:hypothetical protein
LYGAAAGVALLHLALLGAAGGGIGGERPVATTVSVTVRTIEAAPAAARADTPVVAAVEPALGAPLLPPVTSKSLDKGRPINKASARSLEVSVETLPAEAAPARAATAMSSAEAVPAFEATALAASEFDVVDAAPDAGLMKVALDAPRATMASFLAVGEGAPPTYRTVLPGPAILRYELRRGVFRGTGEIRWRPAGDRYALQFEARLAGLTLVAQSSQGELGANGLYPVRFIDQRARKAARAVNFSRSTGTISFSGSTAQWPLLAGTQDRLSWIPVAE